MVFKGLVGGGGMAAHEGDDGLGIDHLEAMRVGEGEGAPPIQIGVGVTAEEPHLLVTRRLKEE